MSSHRNIVPEITPRGVHLLDELQLPSPIPVLDLTFAHQGRLARFMLLVPNPRLDPILAAKSGDSSGSMLPDSPNEIVCHSRVQCSVPPARQDVNVETH